jgi:hypothetical protein
MIVNADDSPENGNFLFRCDANGGSTVYCYGYKILKETPKGCWIMDRWSDGEDLASNVKFKKFVLNSGKKRFAHETRREAIESFLARKRRQYEIIIASLEKCTASYVAAGGTLPITIRTYYADY